LFHAIKSGNNKCHNRKKILCSGRVRQKVWRFGSAKLKTLAMIDVWSDIFIVSVIPRPVRQAIPTFLKRPRAMSARDNELHSVNAAQSPRPCRRLARQIEPRGFFEGDSRRRNIVHLFQFRLTQERLRFC